MAKSRYGTDAVSKSLKPKFNLPSNLNLSLVDYLFNKISKSPQNTPALIDSDTSATISFRHLKRTTLHLAYGLHKLGISKNDVVLIFSPNCHVYPICFLAIAHLGAVATTANPAATTTDLSHQINDCNPKLVITTRVLLNTIHAFCLPTVLLDDGGFQNVVDLGAACRDRMEFEVLQNDVACLLYSSGTTGTSKGVVLTHRNFIAAAAAFEVEKEIAEEGDRVYICFLPMFHVFGLAVVCYSQLVCGNCVVSMAKFEMDALLRSVEKYRVTDVCAVPPVILALVKTKSVVEYDLSSLRKIASGAAPLGKDLMDECALAFPHVVVIQGYGMTETCGIISIEMSNSKATPTGSVGTLVAGVEAKVISIESNKPLPPNNQGEICVRGPNMMRGYLNNEKATKQTIDENEWLHTGDLGYFDDFGNLYIVDRIKELIKYKGFQVAPAELEAMLLLHSDLLDAVVIPYPDEEAGEVPAAYVVRRAKSDITENDVKKFINNQVASYKRLRHVFFIQGVPKSASGKILRRLLVQNARSKI